MQLPGQLPDLRHEVTELEQVQRRSAEALRNDMRRNQIKLEPLAGKRDSCKTMVSLLSALPFSVTPELQNICFHALLRE